LRTYKPDAAKRYPQADVRPEHDPHAHRDAYDCSCCPSFLTKQSRRRSFDTAQQQPTARRGKSDTDDECEDAHGTRKKNDVLSNRSATVPFGESGVPSEAVMTPSFTEISGIPRTIHAFTPLESSIDVGREGYKRYRTFAKNGVPSFVSKTYCRSSPRSASMRSRMPYNPEWVRNTRSEVGFRT
jgi:hypothetical protein